MRAFTGILIVAIALVVASTGAAVAPTDRYAPVLSRVQSLKHSPYARILTIGRTTEGRKISAVVLTDPRDPQTIAHGRERVLFICGQHGDEPSSVRAMLSLAEEMAHGDNPTHRAILERTVVCIVPVANPDGFARSRRLNGQGQDLNRDWDTNTQPETIAIARLVSRFRPQLIVDEHEWLDGAPLRDNSVEIADSGKASQFRLQRMLSDCVTGRLSRDGISVRTANYDQGFDGGLAHRWFGNQGICGMLVETSASWSPEQRAKMHKAFASALLLDVAFPPSQQVSEQLRQIANASRSMHGSIAALYPPRSPMELPQFVPIACLAIFAFLACSVVRPTGPRMRSEEVTLRKLRQSNLALSDILDLELSPRMKAAVLKQCRLRPTDRQDALRKPLADAPVLLDPFENRALGRRWDSGIRRKPGDGRTDQSLRDRVLARRLGSVRLRTA